MAVPTKAVKPVAPPGFDAKAANDAWLKRVLKEDGTPYAVFSGGGFAALNRWQLGIGEYDGKGLVDAVKTNADQQNAMKKDLDSHSQSILELRADVARIEGAISAIRPFP